MQTGRLILLLLLVLVVALVVVLLLRRSAARKEQQRVEAATLRADADQIAARLAGQAAFAQQAAERADVARAEAEQRAREAARLEEEAAEQRAAAEAARREYEQTMRRADDVDPDVTESSFPAVGDADAGHRETREAEGDEAAAAERGAEEPTASGDDVSAGRTTPGATAAGGAAAGAALWGSGDGERPADSERIASAADYRDDTPEAGATAEVSGDVPVGRARGMSDDARPDSDDFGTEREGESPPTSLDSDVSHDVESPRGEWGGPPQDGPSDGADDGADRGADGAADRGADDGADMAVIAEPEAYAATEPVRAEDQTAPVEREPVREEERQWSAPGDTGRDGDAGADAGVDHGADAGADRGADAGADAGVDHGADAGADRGAGTADSGDVAIVADPDQYASTEPLRATGGGALTDDAALADDRGADRDQTPGADDDARAADDRAWGTDQPAAGGDTLADPEAHAPAETGAAVAENDPSTHTVGDDAERTTDGGATRDWAADEGELLEQTHDRGDRLAEERQELAAQGGATTGAGTAERAARRISDFSELRDGGFGVGSAAPLDDGAQPLDHPVQGHRGSMSFHVPGDPGYDTAEPDVWFYDEGSAERAGFRRAGR